MWLSNNSRRVRKTRSEDTEMSNQQPLVSTSYLHQLSLLVVPFNSVHVFPNKNGAVCIYDTWVINVLFCVQGITIMLRIPTRLPPAPYPNIKGHLVGPDLPNIHPSSLPSFLFTDTAVTSQLVSQSRLVLSHPSLLLSHPPSIHSFIPQTEAPTELSEMLVSLLYPVQFMTAVSN